MIKPGAKKNMAKKLSPVTRYWSADSLIWQVSIDHNMMSYIKKVHGKPGQRVSINLLFGVWPHVERLHRRRRVAAVVRTRPREIPLATITWENQFMGFLYFPIWVWGYANNLCSSVFQLSVLPWCREMPQTDVICWLEWLGRNTRFYHFTLETSSNQ